MAAQESSASVSAGSRYVAMGSSFAAGPGNRPPRRAGDAATAARLWAEAGRLTGANLASGLAREAFTQLA